MLKKFVPNKIIKHFSEIDIQTIKDQYKLVLLDIDNTLVGPDDPHRSEDVQDFIESLLANNLQVVLISNNTQERVERFNESLNLNLKVYPMALKPLGKTYRKIKHDHPEIKSYEMLSVGDQVLTDVLGSKRQKIDVYLTDKIVKRDIAVTKINRVFENIIINRLKKKEMWPSE